MTLFKKSLALVLAFAMIFSTMSVMGYAANDGSAGIKYLTQMNADGSIGVDDGTNGITFQFKFFREVQTEGEETPETTDDVYEWQETEKAAPGEKVKARLYVGTDFPVYSSVTAATMFDARFFSVGYSEAGAFTVTTNSSYSQGLQFSGIDAGGYRSNPYNYNKLKGNQSFLNAPGVKTDAEGNTTESYYLPYNFFYAEDGKTIANGLMTTTVLLSGSGAKPLDPNDWIFELELTVKDDSYVKDPERKGFAKTPLELANQKKITVESRAIGLVDIPEYPLGSTNYPEGVPMGSNDIYATTTPGYLSVYSNVTYDAVSEEGGYFSGNNETVTSSGVIGKDKIDGTVTPLNDQGKVFMGWSLTEGGEVLTNTDYANLFYDYEDITLYAVWEESEVSTYYTYEIYQMNPDGTYPSKPISQRFTEKADKLVEIKSTDAPEGFHLDTEAANVLSGVVNANNSTILRAYFARNKYTATYHFSDNNGAQKDQMDLYFGQTIPAFSAVPSGVPKLPGKDFIGWSLSETSNVAVPSVMPNNSIDMYPMYTDSVYTYVYDANGGEFADGETYKSFVYKYGDTPDEFNEIPVMAGHKFSCWDENAPSTVTEDLTFKAIYNVGNYTVKFADSKGNILDEVVLEYGTEITTAYIPDGYKSDAWTYDNGVAVEFPFILEEDVTLNAAEDANLYKVTFLVDGKVYEEYKIASGSDVIVPDENPDGETGFEFVMWDPDPRGQIVDLEDLVFNAIFARGEYVLSFNTDGGTAIEPIKALYGADIKDKLPGANATTKEGYTFVGWDTKLPETMPGENTEVKALWSKNVYSVKFVNGLTGAEIKTVTGEFGSAVAAPVLPEAAGYSFAWDVTPPSTIPAKNEKGELMANGGVMTVTAVPTTNDVTISFDTNGGTPAAIDQIGGKAFAAIDPAIAEPTPPEGMKFVGWDDGKGNIIDTPTVFPAESVKLTAKYENLSYNAIYDPDGGVFADNTTENKKFVVEYGATVPAPAAPTKTNYKFIGWSPVVTTMPAKDVTFTAQWEAIGPVDYTITVYAVNPADGSYLDPIVMNYKAEVGTKLQILEKGSDVPAGVTAIWYEDLYTTNTNIPDAENTSNVLSLEVKAEGENKLVAYFKLETYSAVFDANGGSFKAPAGDDRYSGNQFTVNGTYGETVDLPVEPEKDGYDFKGWKDGETGYIYEDAIPAFAGDVDYTAEWEIKTYDVTFTIVDENGETIFEETVTYDHGEEVVPPAYNPEPGYKFEGWDVPAGTKAEDAEGTYSNDAELVNYDVKYVATTGIPAGGAIPADTTKTAKDTFEVGAATVPDGYSFEGWFINSETGAKADATYVMTAAPVTFYGKFTANTYNINYDVNGGDYMASTPVIFGSEVTTLAVPTKEGNTFKGWVDKDGNAVTDATGKVLDENFTMPAGDILLKATWEENPTYHNVYYTYNIAGIAEAPATEENIQAGTTHTLATAPSDTAEYKFTGWYYNNEKVTSIVMPAGDAHIIGIWEPIVAQTYALTLDANGGKFADGETTNVTNHQANADLSGLKAVKPERDGYVFVDWSPALPATMPNSPLTLKAQWEAEKYTINFNTNGGTAVPPMEVTFGGAVTAPKAPEKPGYEFKGWSPELPKVMDKDLGDNGASITVEAIWEAKKYSVSLDANGGLLSDGTEKFSNSEVEFDTVLSTVAPVADPTRDGYKFLGWTTAGVTGYVTIPAKQPVGGIDYKADWEALGNTIVFDADGGKSVADVSAKTGELVESVPVTTKEGYDFQGWMNEKGELVTDKDGNFIAEFRMPADDIKLKASWLIKSAEVKYEYAGEVPTGITPPEAKKYNYNETVTVEAAPSAEGYTFVGWFIGETPVTPNSTFKMGEEAVTITGKWTKDAVDTRDDLVADANGGKYSDGSTTKNHKFNTGDKVDGVIEEPTRDGYEFGGWSGLNDDGTMPAGDTTIKANWIAKVTIDPNGGKFADGSTDKIETKGNAIDTANKLPVTKENADLLGWKDTISGTIYDEIPATSDVALNLVAQWKDKEQKTITFYVGSKVHQADSYYEGATIVLPEAPTVEGFDFEGWKLKDGSDVPTVMGSEDLEAIAVLTPHKHNVTFYYDAEKTQVYKEYKDVAFGSEVEVPEDPTHPTNPELVFAGWAPTVEAEMPDKDLEYVATWVEIGDKFSAHFIANGETHALHVLSEGEAIPEVPDPKRFGYKFVGWAPEVPETMPAEDMTFEAQWEIDKTFVSVIIGGTVIGGGAIAGIVGTGALIGGSIIGGMLVLWGASEIAKNTFTVTYKVDGEVYKTYKVLAGTKIPVPADPTKDGSEFAGWNPEVPEKMPKEDLVFEATWNADADVEIPSTGSFSGIAALAAISAAGAIAVIASKKKKDEDEE